MNKKYFEYLESQIKEAEEEFNRAKEHAIKDLQNMDIWTATNYGAAYSTKIDDVTKAAQKIMTLSQMLRAYGFYQENDN